MKNTKKVAALAATAYVETRHSLTKAARAAASRRLSEHFTLGEFTRSGTAIRCRVENVPTAADVARLEALCLNVLEPLRRRFGVLRVTSGYRSERLNSLVGGVATSQHCRGEAADLHVSSLEVARKMCEYVREHLDFDQLILESVRKTGARWLHVSYRAGANRRESFTIRK